MDKALETDSLLHMLAAGEIVIFGTGYVADSFWYGLDRYGLTAHVSCFLVSDPGGRDALFHGKPVFPLHEVELQPGAMVCLAVHGALSEELSRAIEARAPGRVIWIYPYLHRMIYGAPTENGIPVRRTDLVLRQDPASHWLSVRYLAARDYLRRAENYAQSREIYLRAMSAHCRPETAVKRLRRLEELADSMAARGFDRDCPILIDTRYRMIDGLHRLAVASVLEIGTIPCDIVSESPAYDLLLREQNRLPEHVLIRAGLTGAQLARLADAKRELISGVLRTE